MDYTLAETGLIQIKTLEKVDNRGTFVIEPLSPGYGVTIGNSLRRVLLSSLEGSAITAVKMAGVTHQFSTIPGIKEDVVEILLNLKMLRFRFNANEPLTLKLSQKGPKQVIAADFFDNPNCEVVNKNIHLASLGKAAKLEMEITVARGRGYVPVEKRKDEKLPIGTIAVDSIFTPVKKVHFEVEKTRVGEATDPEIALSKSAKILVEHFSLVGEATREVTPARPGKTTKKKIAKEATKKSVKKVRKKK